MKLLRPPVVAKPRDELSLKTKLLWILTLAAIIFCITAVATSNIDSTSQCMPPDNVARYRGIGISAGTVYSRIVAFRHDVEPLDIVPDPNSVMMALHNVTRKNQTKASALLWAWMQFLGHDLSLSLPIVNDTSERDDFLFDHHGNRQQLNYASPFLDLSQIYGNTDNEALSVRRIDGSGKLRTIFSTNASLNDSEFPELYVDNRHSDNSLVHALYVLFVREHNKWCDRLHDERPNLVEFEYYNIARHITIAEMQAITYRTVLPLLADTIIEREVQCFAGTERINADYTVDDYVHRSSVFNEVGVALFSLYSTLATPVENIILENTGITALILNTTNTHSNERDGNVVDQFYDVATLAINKTRDHQIPPYVSFLNHYLKRAHLPCRHFAGRTVCDIIENVFGGEDIDLFTGLLIERRDRGLLGAIGRQLVSDQFTHVKHNDYYFYLWDRVVEAYLNEIHHTTFTKLLARNTDLQVQNLRHDLFTKN